MDLNNRYGIDNKSKNKRNIIKQIKVWNHKTIRTATSKITIIVIKS